MSEIRDGRKTQLNHNNGELLSKDLDLNLNSLKLYFNFFFRRRRDQNSSNSSDEEIQRAINYMRRNIPTAANKQQMLEYFSITGNKRAAMVADKTKCATEILHCYPRLRDLYEAVILFL